MECLCPSLSADRSDDVYLVRRSTLSSCLRYLIAVARSVSIQRTCEMSQSVRTVEAENPFCRYIRTQVRPTGIVRLPNGDTLHGCLLMDPM